MHPFKSAVCLLLVSSVITMVAGCGGETDPSTGIAPEQMAPGPENLGSDPEYAKQFGGGKK